MSITDLRYFVRTAGDIRLRLHVCAAICYEVTFVKR